MWQLSTQYFPGGVLNTLLQRLTLSLLVYMLSCKKFISNRVGFRTAICPDLIANAKWELKKDIIKAYFFLLISFVGSLARRREYISNQLNYPVMIKLIFILVVFAANITRSKFMIFRDFV